MSSGLFYAVANAASTDEVAEVAKPLGKWGGVYTAHMEHLARLFDDLVLFLVVAVLGHLGVVREDVEGDLVREYRTLDLLARGEVACLVLQLLHGHQIAITQQGGGPVVRTSVHAKDVGRPVAAIGDSHSLLMRESLPF